MKENIWCETIKKVMPAVVTITISKSLEDIEKEIPAELMPMFPAEGLPIPPDAVDAHGMVKIGSGSGFLVDHKGVVLTNKHVVADKGAEYTVLTNDGKKFKAEVLARDPIDDVAIVKINAKDLSTLELGDSSNLELGQPVLAIGNALGLFKNTVSSGIISGLARSIQAAAEMPAGKQTPMVQEMRGLVQTDAAINPGNSGGPLVNTEGNVVGINTAIVFGAQNLSFAIPINAAKRDLEDLKKHGRIKRPLLGLRYVSVDENMKEKMKLPVGYGAVIMGQGPLHNGVIPHSPAEKAGLKVKDIVLEINGNKVTPEKTIQDFLEEMSVGDVLRMKIMRGRKEFEVKVTLAERK
jgi:S1-C subfamily serine protease